MPMTPLAYQLMSELLKPHKKQAPWCRDDKYMQGIFQHFGDTYCFDVSEVQDLIRDLANKLEQDYATDPERFDPRLAFLAAPSMWIETSFPGSGSAPKGARIAAAYWLNPLTDDPQRVLVDVFTGVTGTVPRDANPSIKLHSLAGSLTLLQQPDIQYLAHTKDHFLVYAMLAIINSPRVIPQDEIQPHRGHARELRQRGLPFEPKPWRKITLSVSRSAVLEATGEDTGTLHGTKAHHFVRRFARIRLGRLEVVKAHWRGNPERGEKPPGTYVVKP